MITHPDKGTVFTDYFGRPINVGDRVVYPTVTGSSSAELTEACVEKVVALIEHPGQWLGSGHIPHVREDQLNRSRPTEYRPHGTWTEGYKDWTPDYSKAYILVVRTKGTWKAGPDGFSERPTTVKNVWNVVIAP